MFPPPDVVGIEVDRTQFCHAVADDLRCEVAAELAALLNGIRSALVLLGEHHEVEALGADADRQVPEVPMYGKLPLAIEIERHNKRMPMVELVFKCWHKKATVLSFAFRTVANKENRLLLHALSINI